MRRSITLVLSTLVIAVLAAAGAGVALAQPVTCGQVITADTTLENDLSNCPGSGLIVGADNVTIDLNGHSLEGDGTFTGFGDVGVDNRGHDGVRVQNGRVSAFAYGILSVDAAGAAILDLEISGNGRWGVQLWNSSRNRIEGNRLLSNAGSGLALFGSTSTTIADNTASKNDEVGIQVVGSFSVVRGNTITENEVGLYIDGTRNDVHENTVSHQVRGILLVSDGDNRLANNSVFAHDSDGIRLAGTSQNVVDGNDLRDNGEAGLFVEGLGMSNGPTLSSDDNVLSGNTSNANRGDGILIASRFTTGTRLERNVTNSNEEDGIDVDSPSASVAVNSANFNGDLGIEGTAGISDGGSNTAGGNGNPLQCTFVVCDHAAPVLNLPDSVITGATSRAGAAVSYSVTATDDADPDPTVTCEPPSGSTFPVGTTTVICSATDASGKQAAGSFKITVRPFLPTNKAECKDAGWRSYGSIFRNQGECVAFVNRSQRP